MWIRKFQRDLKKGVDSPMPTQLVSNEEFIPRRQSEKQKQVEHLIGADGRREIEEARHGAAAALWPAPWAWPRAFWPRTRSTAKYWDVDEAETLEPAASAEKWPKGEYFIMDVQTHFTNGVALDFRTNEFIKNMGFKLKNDPRGVRLPATSSRRCSSTARPSMIVISGVPGPRKSTRRSRAKSWKAAPAPAACCRAG